MENILGGLGVLVRLDEVGVDLVVGASAFVREADTHFLVSRGVDSVYVGILQPPHMRERGETCRHNSVQPGRGTPNTKQSISSTNGGVAPVST